MAKRLVLLSVALMLLASTPVAHASLGCINSEPCGGGKGHKGSAFADTKIKIHDGGYFEKISASGGSEEFKGVFEGDDCVFPVVRKGKLGKFSKVDWKTKNGTAKFQPETEGDGDYERSSGTLNFEPEQDFTFIVVHTFDNFDSPGSHDPEFFKVVLSDPKKAVIADGKAKCFIHEFSKA